MKWDDELKDDMRKLRKRMRRWITGEDGWEESDSYTYRRPWADFSEDEKNYSLRVELPGINKEDIMVSTTSNSLIIKGRKEREEDRKNENSYHFEKSYAGFYRKIPLPEGADKENIEASFNNGILNIIIPKFGKDGKGKGFIRVK